MRASVDSVEALRLLKVEHAAVKALIDALTPEEMTRPDTIEYGLYADQELSFQGLLAHLVCYEAYALEAIDHWQNGAKHWIIDAMANSRESTKIHYAGIADRAHFTLDEQLEEWETVRTALETRYANFAPEDWRSPAPYPTNQPTDLGGMLEPILVAPPRPMYRHLPVHIPDSDAYIARLRSEIVG